MLFKSETGEVRNGKDSHPAFRDGIPLRVQGHVLHGFGAQVQFDRNLPSKELQSSGEEVVGQADEGHRRGHARHVQEEGQHAPEELQARVA